MVLLALLSACSSRNRSAASPARAAEATTEAAPPREGVGSASEAPARSRPNLGPLVVAIGPLQGDADRALRQRLEQRIRVLCGHIAVLETAVSLPMGNGGPTHAELRKQVEDALASAKADVILWGAVDAGAENPAIHLRFGASRVRWADPSQPAAAGTVTIRLSAPAGFEERLQELLDLLVWSHASSFDPGLYPAHRGAPLVGRVRDFVVGPASTDPTNERPHARRRATSAMARWSVESRWEALEAYATAVASLAEGQARTEGFEESLAVRERALEVLDPGDSAHRAATHLAMGGVLLRLSERTSGAARRRVLTKAVSSLRGAVADSSGDADPSSWGDAQNQLGIALARVAQQDDSDTASLVDAVAAFRAALHVHIRERTPLLWAMVQNNLGNVLVTLADRVPCTSCLHEAIAAFRATLDVWQRDRAAPLWAMAQNNLGNALEALGERVKGTTRLSEAVDAFHAALEERTRDRDPIAWATTQVNLGIALRTLADRRGFAPCAAVEAHYQALVVFRTHAPQLVNLALHSLAQDLEAEMPPSAYSCSGSSREQWANIEAILTHPR